jgi:hypothetical protein
MTDLTPVDDLDDPDQFDELEDGTPPAVEPDPPVTTDEMFSGFAPMATTDPRHKPMQSLWAAEVKAALRNGRLSEQELEIVRGLDEQADVLPHGTERSELLQRAHFVVRRAQAAARAGAPAELRSTQMTPQRDGSSVVRTTDQLGRMSVTVINPPDVETSPLADPLRPWIGHEGPVTTETMSEWPMDIRVRFRAEHPNAWDALLTGAAVNLGAAAAHAEPPRRRGLDTTARTALADRQETKPGLDTLVRNRHRINFSAPYGGDD